MNSPLSHYSKNVFSQRGEDGILEQVFNIIGTENKWCVEFGAWDGKLNSNTANLVKNKTWSAVMIESDPIRYQELLHTYQDNTKVTSINAFVQFEGANTLDALLKKTAVPKSFDLLSIDIDGNDYHIWDSIKSYSPRVVVIEINPTIPADVEFVQKKDVRITQGSSLLSLCKLAKQKGYELVEATQLNGIFVRAEYFPLFKMADNSPTKLKETQLELRIFQLYDGTIVTKGVDRMLWHRINLTQSSFQIIPRIFRTFPDNMNKLQFNLFRIWKKIRNARR